MKHANKTSRPWARTSPATAKGHLHLHRPAGSKLFKKVKRGAWMKWACEYDAHEERAKRIGLLHTIY